MTERKAFDLLSVLGLILSAVAVCDMLAKWNIAALRYADLLYGTIIASIVLSVLFSRKIRENLIKACRGKPKLLLLRTILAALIALLGLYINSSMKYLGMDETMTAYNGVRLIAVVFTLFGHIFYMGLTKRANSG